MRCRLFSSVHTSRTLPSHRGGSCYHNVRQFKSRQQPGMICLVARRQNQDVPEDSNARPEDEQSPEQSGHQPQAEHPPPLLPEPEYVEAKAALPEPAPEPHPSSEQDAQQVHAGNLDCTGSSIQNLQQSLLGALASLDRGVAATVDDVRRVDNLVRQIEAAGGPVVFHQDPSPSTIDTGNKKSLLLLDGRWRLVYSSGFAGGSLGGRRPGPPTALFPLTLGQVYQDINLALHELDNVVTLVAKLSLAALPGVDANPPAITARLKHTFSLEGAATIRITFQDTIVQGSGGLAGWLDNLPQFSIPQIPRSLREGTKGLRGATFDVSFIDSRMRITRGDRGELRVFLRD